MNGDTPEQQLWAEIQAQLSKRDQELREWQAQRDQREAVHIEQVSRSLAANHLVVSASIDRLGARIKHEEAPDSEEDLHRYETGAGISQTLLQLLAVNLKLEAYVDSKRVALEQVLALQHEVLGLCKRIDTLNDVIGIQRATLAHVQTIIGYWHWFRFILITLLTLVIIGIGMLIVIIIADVQILRGIGASFLGGFR